MAGNSKRQGAVRRRQGGNPPAGSGGRRRRALEGRGPTPKAAEREAHKAHRNTSSPASRVSRSRPSSPRDGAAAEWVAGRNAVLEALLAGVPATSAYVAERVERDDRLRQVFALSADRGLPVLEVSRAELDRVTGRALHQGVALKVRAYEYAHPSDVLDRAAESGDAPLLVALDSVTDPRNLGAVVRSAAAFGAHGVVVPERRAAGLTAGAWKTSAGAAARVPVARATNLTRQLRDFRDAGLTVIGLAADGDVDIRDLAAATEPLVLVVGSEGQGLSRLVTQTCDVLVKIPMAAATESLNAGVAAGIALYEIDRQRRAAVGRR
jgi:23S rRNA (guanosine2251-2'-O)-methyltransferase